jgi:hypothetical protein
MAYFAEISLPKYNSSTEYYFLDVFEQLILLMIIRREIINVSIKTKHFELLGIVDENEFNGYNDLLFQIKNCRANSLHESVRIEIVDESYDPHFSDEAAAYNCQESEVKSYNKKIEA